MYFSVCADCGRFVIWLLLYNVTVIFTDRLVVFGIDNKPRELANSEIFFIKHPQSQDVEEGKRLRLECVTSGAQQDKEIFYQWMVNGRYEPLMGRQEASNDDKTLVIPHADRDLDNGNFTCIAGETGGMTRSSYPAPITVYYMSPYAKVRLISHKGDLKSVKPSDVIRLKCEHGNAYPKIKGHYIVWYHNGQKISPGRLKTIKSNGELQFPFYPRESGIYHCRVGHSAGRVYSQPFPIYITESGKFFDYDVSDFIKYVPKNGDLKLECPKIRNKTTIITWSKKDVFNDNSGLVVDMSIGDSKLVIKNNVINIKGMVKHFMGHYICEHKSLGFSEEVKYEFLFTVRIPSLPEILPSQFTPPLNRNKPIIGRKNHPLAVRFYIDLTSNKEPSSKDTSPPKSPDPVPEIMWLNQNNQMVTSCDSIDCRYRLFVLHNQHLMIRNARTTDSGTYTLSIHSVAGRKTQKVEIVITSQPEFQEPVQSVVTVDEGVKSVSLKCKTIDRLPINATTITWQKDDVDLPKYWNRRLLENSETMLIEMPSARDNGKYKCVARTWGYQDEVTSSEITLKVKEKLKIINWNSSAYFENNKKSKLFCTVKGYGNIKIGWVFPDPNWKNSWPDGMSVQNGATSSVITFDKVSYLHKGLYTCFVSSSYKNQSLSKTVEVSVGVKPEITISGDQHVAEGSSIMLNCSTSSNKKVSWFMKSGNNPAMKSFQGLDLANSSSNWSPVPKHRKGKLFWISHPNGSLELRQLNKSDNGDYTCFAFFSSWNPSLIHKSLKLSVFNNEDPAVGVDITKTIAIVVSCALAYLLLIVFLTVSCSLKRRIRAKKVAKQEYQNLQQQQNNFYGYNNGNMAPTITTSAPNGYSSVPSYVNATASYLNDVTDSRQIMPPPPTPMGSRSQLSGNSSSIGNSASYTRSHLSGASAGGTYQTAGASIEKKNYLRSNLKVEGMFGRCDFGDVSLAVAHGLQEKNTPCLTYVKSLISRDSAHVKEFHRQKDMLSRCDNEFIVKLLAVSFEADPLLLIFEYCEWGDLKRFLRCMAEKAAMKVPQLNYAQKINMANQVAFAMEHMSSLHLVHRDLAARNILLSPDLNLKVASLNMSVQTDEDEYFTIRDKKLPLRWLSPEVLNKELYTSKSDVWAFGIFVYELFSLGSLPYKHLSDHEVLALLKKSSLYLEIPSNFSADVRNLIEICLALDSKDRPTFSEIVISIGGITVNDDV